MLNRIYCVESHLKSLMYLEAPKSKIVFDKGGLSGGLVF